MLFSQRLPLLFSFEPSTGKIEQLPGDFLAFVMIVYWLSDTATELLTLSIAVVGVRSNFPTKAPILRLRELAWKNSK